jgi:hypothetical protein
MLWQKIENSGINFTSIAWGEGFFFAGGEGGKVAWSADGVTWFKGVIGPMSPRDIYGVAVGKILNELMFVAVGAKGRIAYSIGGPQSQWYEASLTPFGTNDNAGEDVRAVAFGIIEGSGYFVAVGDDGKIAFCNDFTGHWYGGRSGSSETLSAITFGNDKFIVAGKNGIIRMSSNPKTHWHIGGGSVFGGRAVLGLAFDPIFEQFTSIVEDSVVGFSPYGDSWSAASFRSRFPDGISAVTCTAKRIVLGGGDGSIFYSN